MFKLSFIASPGARKLASLLLGCVLAALLLLVGLEGPAEPRCSFGPDRVVAASRGKRIDAIALCSDGQGPVAFWSDIEGLFARRLDAEGRPTASAVRLGPRCQGGIDARAGQSGFVVACLRRPSWQEPVDDAPDGGDGFGMGGAAVGDGESASAVVAGLAPARGNGGGIGGGGKPLPYGPAVGTEGSAAGVTVYTVTDRLVPSELARFQGAGTMSRGVSLGEVGGRLRVAWHDGSPDRQQVWLVEMGDGSKDAPPRVISDPLRLAGAPQLAPGDQGWVVWAETWMQAERTRGQVTLYDGRGAPRSLLDVSYPNADPRIIEVEGRRLLTYRQRRKSVGRAGLYLAWMDEDGRVLGEPVRVARADADAPPAVDPCLGGLVVAAPRTYGASQFVGVNLLERSFDKRGGEQHFYDVSREMSLAAAACPGAGSLLLVAEQGASSQKDTRVRSINFGCE